MTGIRVQRKFGILSKRPLPLGKLNISKDCQQDKSLISNFARDLVLPVLKENWLEDTAELAMNLGYGDRTQTREQARSKSAFMLLFHMLLKEIKSVT